uniref:hypothetical protein n=1 Tax=Trametes maxima TaxID=259368 RepID=UPI0030036E46|nr:hypothetical protein [Trametes maxima]
MNKNQFYNIIWSKFKTFIGFKYLRNSILNNIINALDYLLIIIVIFALVHQVGTYFIFIVSSIINHFIELFNMQGLDFIHNMVDTTTNTNTNNTTTTIVQNDGSWSDNIRTLFIYGTGAYRLHLIRNTSTPGSRLFVIASTVAGDAVTKIVNYTINDPSYVKNQVINWKAIWQNPLEGEASVTVDAETVNKLINVPSNSYINSSDSISDFLQMIVNSLFNQFKLILEPVQVDYSNEILANQIYDLSILLFVLGLIIVFLIIILLLNIILYINMDSIIKIFNNKYIKWYLIINKKFLSIEIFILGITILYFMQTLITGIHFIATHPIIY